MVSPSADLQRSYQNLVTRFSSLEVRDRSVRGRGDSFIRGISDWFSGAGRFEDTYFEAFQNGRYYLAEAQRHLGTGDQANAAIALRNADRYLDRAELFWGGYLRTTRGGAESVTTALNTLSKGFLVMGGVGLGAVALGFGGLFAASLAGGGGFIGAFFGSGDGFGLINPSLEQEPKKETSLLGPGATRVTPKRETKKEEKKPILCDGFDGREKEIKGGEQCFTPESDEIPFEEIERKTRPPSPIRQREIQPVPKIAHLIAKVVRAIAEFAEMGFSSIKIGRTLLDYDKATDTSGMSHSYFSFLVKGWHERLEQYRKELAGVTDWKEQFRLLRGFLDRDYFYDYDPEQARLLGLLDKKGGSCEARTKLFLYALEELKIAIPSGWRLGVQRFQGERAIDSHVQLVLVHFDEETKEVSEVWNLQDNETLTTVKAPIYDPLYLLYGLLLAQGITPSVPLEKLLIAAPPAQEFVAMKAVAASPVGEGIKSNSNLVLPGGAGSYSDSPNPPKRGFSPRGSGGAVSVPSEEPRLGTLLSSISENYEKGIRETFAVLVNPQVTVGQPFVMRITSEDFDPQKSTQDGKNIPIVTPNFVRQRMEEITFERSEDARTFIHLPDDEEQRRFLIYLTEQYLERLYASPEFRLAKRLLERPAAVLREQDPESLRKAIRLIERIDRTINSYAESLTLVGGRWPVTGLGRNREALQSSPHYQFLKQQKTELFNAIEKSPEDYILLIDRLPPEKRQQFMELMGWLYRGGPDASHKFTNALANRRRIGVGRREGYEPLKIKVNLVYLPDASINLPVVTPRKADERPVGPVDQKGQKGIGKRGEAATARGPEARHYISASTMVDLILRYGHLMPGIGSRWNPTLSHEYERMTRRTKRDREFLSVLPHLIRAYTMRSRTRYIDTGETITRSVPGGGERKKIFIQLPPDLARIVDEIRKRNPEAFRDLIGSLATSLTEADIFAIER